MASGWWKSTHANLAEGSPADFEVTTVLQAPRGYPKIASIATGAGLFLGGTPSLAIDGVMYYAGDDYVQDTDKPVLCRYDGRIHTVVLEIPYITGTTPRKAILSLAVDDEDRIFISTWDSGTTASNFVGSIFCYDVHDGITKIDGSLFTGGKLPLVMAVLDEALYVGVSEQDPAVTTSVIKLPLHGGLPGGPGSPTATLTGTTWTYEVGALNGAPSVGTFIANTPQINGINRSTLNATYKNDLSWGSVPGAAVSYRVARMSGVTPNVIVDIPAVGTTTYSDDGTDNSSGAYGEAAETMTLTVTPSPAHSTTTSYRVGAVFNEWEFISDEFSVSAPATLFSDLYVALSWSAVSGATAYRVYRTAGHTSTGLISTTASLALNDTGLAGTGTVPEAYSSVALTSGAVACLVPFNNDLYIGSYQPAGTFGKVFKLTTAGVLSTSQTAAPGGTAQAYNGYTAGIVFEDNLYMGYWNDDATDICLIQKFDGAAWSTVSTVSGAGARPWIAFCEADGMAYAYGGGDAKTGILYESEAGASWADVSGLLPSSKEAIPFMGNVNILGGF